VAIAQDVEGMTMSLVEPRERAAEQRLERR
jgi:hypothetical protein